MEYYNNNFKNDNINQNGNSSDLNEKDIVEAFQYFDIDHNGKINVDEMKEILKSFGEMMTEEEINKIFRTLNINEDKNGYIDYIEFLNLFKNNEQNKK